MDIERLRQITSYSDANRDDMKTKVNSFYSFAGMNSDKDVLNILQIARTSLKKMGYLVLEIPFADKEIGALCYKGDALGYIVLNTSLPKVNLIFALCHELYHVFYQKSSFRTKVEFANSHYYENEEELAANLFAGMLLMPESGFRNMFSKFKEESAGEEKDTLIRLMNYYQVPYMAVLIRGLELGLLDGGKDLEKIVNVTQDSVRARLVELWLDDSILNATKKDDYAHLESMIAHLGQEYIRGSYINERTLKKVLQNMQILYAEIKGE